MRDLLLAVQGALRSGLDSTVYRIGSSPAQGDVFIAEADQFIPTGCKFPAVGIKDGLETLLKRQACGVDYIEEYLTQEVKIIAWAPSLSGTVGAGVIGDATQPGVLTIKDDVQHILRDNMLCSDLGVEQVERGIIQQSLPVQQADGRVGQFLVIPYTFTRRIKYLSNF